MTRLTMGLVYLYTTKIHDFFLRQTLNVLKVIIVAFQYVPYTVLRNKTNL